MVKVKAGDFFKDLRAAETWYKSEEKALKAAGHGAHSKEMKALDTALRGSFSDFDGLFHEWKSWNKHGKDEFVDVPDRTLGKATSFPWKHTATMSPVAGKKTISKVAMTTPPVTKAVHKIAKPIPLAFPAAKKAPAVKVAPPSPSGVPPEIVAIGKDVQAIRAKIAPIVPKPLGPSYRPLRNVLRGERPKHKLWRGIGQSYDYSKRQPIIAARKAALIEQMTNFRRMLGWTQRTAERGLLLH